MTLTDLRSSAIDSAVERVRSELEASGPAPAALESIVRLVRDRLEELAADDAPAGGGVSVQVHFEFDAVAVEILAGPARDWIQLS